MKCIKCGETREAEFYPSCIKRRDYRCKRCVYAGQRKWVKAHIEWCREYKRNYMRNYNRENPEHRRESSKRRYANNPELQYERRKRYAQANPQRQRAHGYALEAFPEAQVCEIGDCTELGERHHDDYSKPYEIRWLCRKHHKELSRI